MIERAGQTAERSSTRIEDEVRKAPTPDVARRALEKAVKAEFDSFGAPARQQLAGTPERKVRLDASAALDAQDKAGLLDRRLQQTIRALRRESDQGSSTATRVLGHDATRLLIESAAWRRLSALIQSQHADAPALAHWLDKTGDPQRYRALASMAFSEHAPKAGAAAAAPATPLTPSETAALLDILHSSDPQYGALVREKLQNGASAHEVRDLLVERLVPVSAEARAAAPKSREAVAGLQFDLGLNKWVEKDKSWSYPVKLRQLFDYHVPGIIEGKDEILARLTAAATDPATGKLEVSRETIDSFLEDLAAAARASDPKTDQLLDSSFDLCFQTTNGGDTPVGALWELPVKATADLFKAMQDPKIRAHLADVAAQQRSAEQKRHDALVAPLGDLIQQFPGVPRRHKRAHAALINLGTAGQSVRDMGAAGGVLPRDKTVFGPDAFKARYAEADHLKLRFLFNDDFELSVISDEDFQKVVAKYHFPPNHELLSYNRPIAGSGYLTVDHGKIVGIEDDTVMLPGKLPDKLSPAEEVLRRQGFALDEAAIAASSRVVDFDAFLKLAQTIPAAVGPVPDVATARQRLAQAPHADRPALVLGLLRRHLDDLRAASPKVPDAALRERTAAYAAQLLEGFRLINVSIKNFRAGDLPPDMNDFDELMVDAKLAPYLVRKLP